MVLTLVRTEHKIFATHRSTETSGVVIRSPAIGHGATFLVWIFDQFGPIPAKPEVTLSG
jgi:hypothetical protein